MHWTDWTPLPLPLQVPFSLRKVLSPFSFLFLLQHNLKSSRTRWSFKALIILSHLLWTLQLIPLRSWGAVPRTEEYSSNCKEGLRRWQCSLYTPVKQGSCLYTTEGDLPFICSKASSHVQFVILCNAQVVLLKNVYTTCCTVSVLAYLVILQCRVWHSCMLDFTPLLQIFPPIWFPTLPFERLVLLPPLWQLEWVQ